MSIMPRLLSTACLLLFVASACQSERIVIVTATPEFNITATFEAAMAATEAAPTPTATLTPTPNPFPTPVIGAIYIAEQRFEGGSGVWPVGIGLEPAEDGREEGRVGRAGGGVQHKVLYAVGEHGEAAEVYRLGL